MESQKKMKRIPPPSPMKKDLLRVWEGWNLLGNREIIREAAVKGTHINELIKFLSLRQQISEDDAMEWFKKEVSLFVDELLNRKQIFRASHILNNIKENSSQELSKKMYTTCDAGLREYIGSHLLKFGEMNNDIRQLWDFLHIITKHINILAPKFNLLDLDKVSLEVLDKQDPEWKWELASILFLKSYDERLMPFVNREALWRQLLKMDEVEIMEDWIHFTYDGNRNDSRIHKNLKAFMANSPITDCMLNYVALEYRKESTKDAILNEFSNFGVFCDSEQSDIAKMLKRMFDARCIENTFSIISSKSSVISLEDFLSQLIDFCLKHDLYSVLSSCLGDTLVPDIVKQRYDSDEHFSLICDFKYLFSNFTEWALRSNIVKVSRYLCMGGDFHSYLKDNSDAALALLTLTKDVSFLEVITRKKAFLVDSICLNDIYNGVLKKYALLSSVYKHLTEPRKVQVFNLYDLLDCGHVIKTRELFSFRFDNKFELPHFDEEQLIKEYGYNKEIDYIVYLKHNRPTIAATTFVDWEILKYKSVTKCNLEKVVTKTTRYILRNFDNVETCVSCITFLEMLGHGTGKLRNFINIAKLLQEMGYPRKTIETLFERSRRDLESITKHLEEVLINDIDFEMIKHDGAELVKSVKHFTLVVEFCKYNELKLPELFLKYCAKRNSWFHFLLFAQIHDYPLDQVAELVHNFKNPNIIEHIEHAITHDIPMHGHHSLMRRRDSRSSYLSRVGVRRQPQPGIPQETEREILSKIFSRPRTVSSGTTASSEFGETIIILHPRATLLQILIKCHGSSDPPRALLQACQFYKYPLLAIFATCYEPDSFITCWLTWLAVSCNLCETFTNYESIAFCPTSVSKLLNRCIQQKYPKTVLESFAIFLPNNPLRIFIAFITSCISFELDLDSLSCKLAEFSDAMKKLRRHSSLTEVDKDMSYLTNKVWIEAVALQLLGTALNSNLKSLNDQIIIMKGICDLDWHTVLSSVTESSLKKVLGLLEILYESKNYAKTFGTKYSPPVTLDFCELLNEENHKKEITNCINTLLDEDLFEAALKVAKFYEIPIDWIVTTEWKRKFILTETHDETFWIECDTSFIKHKLKPECVIEFYRNRLEKIGNSLHAYKLQKLMYKWANEFQLPNQYDLEMMMWLTYINLDPESRKEASFYTKNKIFSYRKLVEDIKTVPYCDTEINETQRKQIEELLSEILDAGNFWLALKIERMFVCNNADLKILKLCFSLAEGIIKPYELNHEQRSLLNTKTVIKKRSRRLWNVMPVKSSLKSSTHSYTSSRKAVDFIDAPVQDTLGILQTLTEKLSSGVGIGENIVMLYRISVNTETPYTSIVSENNSLKFLRTVLRKKDCLNKLEIVHDVLTVYEWSKDEIADFICEAIVRAASKYVTSKVYSCIMWDLDLDTSFGYILRLLQDNTSLLGFQLFSYTNAVYSANVASELRFKAKDLILMTELLIRAHDCFSINCNMEGITLVLRLSHKIVTQLLEVRSWKSMVRLLTGIGRYTEMKYVFHILKDHDQFEYLLRKNLRNDTAFKFALLDFLKKYCPKNYELLKMVALHFALYSEVAQLWETEAETVISHLITIAKMEMQNNEIDINVEPLVLLTKTDGTRNLLTKAMQNYEHATEFHMQGEKLKSAMRTVRQAELIALQMSIFKDLPVNETAVCVLNLTPFQIDLIIKNHLGFFQSKMLVEAYFYEPEWGEVLYERYVKGQQPNYLQHFLRCFQLTDSIIDNIIKIYLNSGVNSNDETKAMKDIVNNIHSMHTKYRIASELGFKELLEDLLDGDELCYLRDTVWKRGYKCQEF